MKVIEVFLEKLDHYFEAKKESEYYIILFAILLGIGMLSYNYLIPWTKAKLKKDLATERMLRQTIRDHQAYLNSITVHGDRRYQIKKIEQEIQRLKKEFADLKEMDSYTDYQILTLSSLLFNEQNWAKFLNSISQKAEKYHIELFSIANHFVDQNRTFGHMLEIAIRCKGGYKPLVRFMNDIEESELVVDLYQIQMESNRTIYADLNISVWGINY